MNYALDGWYDRLLRSDHPGASESARVFIRLSAHARLIDYDDALNWSALSVPAYHNVYLLNKHRSQLNVDWYLIIASDWLVSTL